jgi:hypothetical protein
MTELPEEGGAQGGATPSEGVPPPSTPPPRVNVLYAVLALLPELATDELEVVRAELASLQAALRGRDAPAAGAP